MGVEECEEIFEAWWWGMIFFFSTGNVYGLGGYIWKKTKKKNKYREL